MLLFKKKFLDAIRRGEKTQTIRLWKYRLMRPGQRSYIPGIGPVWIDRVEPIELAELADRDAQLDGFASVDTLCAELRELYGPVEDSDRHAYRVVFRLAEQPTEG